MKILANRIPFLILLGVALSFGQNLCPKFLMDSSMVVNIEGKFINLQQSRVSLAIEWRHHLEAPDTFFVNLTDQPSYKFITAKGFRYIEYSESKAKRQLGYRHLKEYIGSTPLRLDDMELLANGNFLCKDTTSENSNTISTAFSNMWWSLTPDSTQYPKQVIMKGNAKEVRTLEIGSWKEFSGVTLPTLISIKSAKYSGGIWVRSADPISTSDHNTASP